MHPQLPWIYLWYISKGHTRVEKPASKMLVISSLAPTMAFLEFLSRAARARIIASNFRAGADDLLNWRLLGSAASHFGLLEFALLLALEFVFDFVDGRGHVAGTFAIGRRK